MVSGSVPNNLHGLWPVACGLEIGRCKGHLYEPLIVTIHGIHFVQC